MVVGDGPAISPYLERAPQALVPGRAIEIETERLLREWKAIAPDAYAHWNSWCEARKNKMRAKGLTKSGEFMVLDATPDWIYYGIGRFLKEPDWPRKCPGAKEAIWRVMPCNRMGKSTSGTCAADKSLRK